MKQDKKIFQEIFAKVLVMIMAAESAITNAATFDTGKESMKPGDDLEGKEVLKRDEVIMERGNQLLVSLFTTCETRSHSRTVFDAEEPKELSKPEMSVEGTAGQITRTRQRSLKSYKGIQR